MATANEHHPVRLGSHNRPGKSAGGGRSRRHSARSAILYENNNYNDSVLWPILGILFLPWTTLAYLTVWQPEGSFEGWAVFVLVLGVFMDLFTHLGGGFRNRRRFRR